MSLEFRHDELVVRVDEDVAEIFWRGAFSHRLLVDWLAVKVQPSIRGRLIVKLTSAPADSPLYEVQPKARPRPSGRSDGPLMSWLRHHDRYGA